MNGLSQLIGSAPMHVGMCAHPLTVLGPLCACIVRQMATLYVPKEFLFVL